MSDHRSLRLTPVTSRWLRLGLLGLGFALAACKGRATAATSPGQDPRDGARVVPKSLVGDLRDPPVVLAMACTPTGEELCFNAADDNCNGIIDEGCGSGGGVLQFTIAWGDSPADVDLRVRDPSGARTAKKRRSTRAGLRLEQDCPDDGCHGQNVENIVFGGTDPPRGTYRVEVKLVDPRDAELPVKVRVAARVGVRTFEAEVLLSPEPGRETWGYSFEL